MNIAPNHITQEGIGPNPLTTKIVIAINQDIATPKNKFFGPSLFISLPTIIPNIIEKTIPPRMI